VEPGEIDLFRVEGRPFMSGMARLTTPLTAFLLGFSGGLFGAYNVTRRRLGGIARVLFGLGQLILALGQFLFQLFDLGRQLGTARTLGLLRGTIHDGSKFNPRDGNRPRPNFWREWLQINDTLEKIIENDHFHYDSIHVLIVG